MTSVPIEEMAVLDADNMTASVGGDSSKQSLSQKIQRIYHKNRPRTAAWMQRGHSKKNDDDSSIFTSTTTSLAPYQELVTSPAALTRSIYVLRFAVFADTVNGMILQPNYAIMVSPDAHEESFPSTDPFDFSSATYFIPMVRVHMCITFVRQAKERSGECLHALLAQLPFFVSIDTFNF